MRSHQIKVTLDDTTGSAIRSIASVSGKSMSSVVASMIQPYSVQLAELACLLERAQSLRFMAEEGFEGFLDEVMAIVVEANDNGGVLPESLPDAESHSVTEGKTASGLGSGARTIGAPCRAGYRELGLEESFADMESVNTNSGDST